MCSLSSVVCAVFRLCYVQFVVCLVCSIYCLWLAAEAARAALLIPADMCIYNPSSLRVSKMGGVYPHFAHVYGMTIGIYI